MPTILLVDDDSDTRELIAMVLGQRNLRVLQANTAAAALAQQTATMVDLAVLDLGLPDAHGLEIVEKLRANQPGLPVIVLSGRTDPELVLAAQRAGIQHFVAKPVAIPELAKLITTSLPA